MKYIIPQDKLDNIVFRYLDTILKNLEKRKAKYYKGTIFTHNDETHGILGYKNNGNLYINYELTDEISSVFGLSGSDSGYVITRWFIDRFQLKVKNTYETVGDTLRCKS